MRKPLRTYWHFVCALGLAMLATPAMAQLKVVASFSILADLVQEVGGEQVQVFSLVGPEQDAHTYQPRPSDLARLQQADLVVINGLGFEGWLERAVRGSGYQGQVVMASAGVPVLRSADDHDHHYNHHAHDDQDHESGHDDDHGSNHEHEHGSGSEQASESKHESEVVLGHADPHAWQDPVRVQHYVANIARALSEQDPQHASLYQQRAEAYQIRLQALDAELLALLRPMAEAKVQVMTPHASFAYLADRYGLEFVALQGANVAGDANAGELARLIREVKAKPGVVLFSETVAVPQVLQQLARETGLDLQGRLYSDMLSEPSGPAGNYMNMMRFNAQQLAQAEAAHHH